MIIKISSYFLNYCSALKSSLPTLVFQKLLLFQSVKNFKDYEMNFIGMGK